jgi:site-specific DNA-cytosine methylase
MNHASLCTGVGGFELAADWIGWTNAFHCEIDKYNRKVLKNHWPQAISYEDVTTTNFTIHRDTIDILTFGEPCQPHSQAGLRKGEADTRFLWPHCRRAYNEIMPAFILNENVPGSITNGVLDKKISELESDGYTCWPPLVIPAGAGEALHKRNRVWLVAYSMRSGWQQQHTTEIAREEKKRNVWNSAECADAHGHESRTPDKSAILRMADGLPSKSHRNRRIKAMGNAVDPRIVYQIFKAIEIAF